MKSLSPFPSPYLLKDNPDISQQPPGFCRVHTPSAVLPVALFTSFLLAGAWVHVLPRAQFHPCGKTSGAVCFRVCVLGFVCWTHWYLGDETHSSQGTAEQICSQPIVSSFIGVFLQRDASHCLLFSAGVLQPLQERQGQRGADPPRPLGPLL